MLVLSLCGAMLQLGSFWQVLLPVPGTLGNSYPRPLCCLKGRLQKSNRNGKCKHLTCAFCSLKSGTHRWVRFSIPKCSLILENKSYVIIPFALVIYSSFLSEKKYCFGRLVLKSANLKGTAQTAVLKLKGSKMRNIFEPSRI